MQEVAVKNVRHVPTYVVQQQPGNQNGKTMYGLIHKELRNMIQENYGEETWNKIITASGVPVDCFLTMRSYDDSLAFDLVAATSSVLATPAEKCLELFGRYWLLNSAPRSYENLLEITGQDFFEFLENLDVLHDRITSTFTDFRPPSFRLERLSENEAKLHYISSRQGLTPFVEGLLYGMAERFADTVDIVNTESLPVERGTHTVFTIKIGVKSD